MKTKKLYRVDIKAIPSSMGTSYDYAYVIAGNSDEAYKKYRAFLDEKDLFFSSDRGMESVSLVADAGEYGDCDRLLIL